MTSVFPYPVWSDESDDYIGPRNEIEVKSNLDEDVVNFYININIKDNVINDLIKSRKAVFAARIESPSTFYRTLEKFEDNQFSISVDNCNIGGEIFVTPYILALEEITDYSNNNLNEDYKGMKVRIPKNGLILRGQRHTFTIERKNLKLTQSICTFRSWDSDTIAHDATGEKIIINLPQELFRNYHNTKNKIKKVCTSMFAIPVLIDVINDAFILKREYVGLGWYDSLEQKISACPKEHMDSAYEIVKWLVGNLQIDSVNYLFIAGVDHD